MGRNTKPRKAYRPRQLVDPVLRATTGVRLLARADVESQLHIARTALAELGRGHHTLQHWCSLADTANMAESLARLGIGAGPDAEHVIQLAQHTLNAIHGRLQAGTVAMKHAEIEALLWLISVHATQLRACSYSEFDAAFCGTRNRIAQARAGNAPARAVIVEGEIA